MMRYGACRAPSPIDRPRRRQDLVAINIHPLQVALTRA
jgi:hypothetical protein